MRHILNNKGVSLVEVLGASAIVAILTVLNVNSLQAFLLQQNKSRSQAIILKQKNNIISSLQSSDTLAKIGQSEGINCLVTRQNCSALGNTPYAFISVQDQQGIQLTDRAVASFGFNKENVACNTFPSDECPFRYEVQWRAKCASVMGCAAPLFQARATLFIHPGLRSQINTQKYGFTMNLGQVLGTYEQSCTSIGGVFISGVPPQCQLPMTGSCPDDSSGNKQVVWSYNRLANPPTKNCRPVFWDVSCPAGFVMIGIAGTGLADCRQIIFTCEDGSTVNDLANCPVAPLPCQSPSPPPECFGDGGGGGGGDGGGDGGCGGGGDGCP